MIALGSGRARLASTSRSRARAPTSSTSPSGSFGGAGQRVRGGAGSATTLTLEDAQARRRRSRRVTRMAPMRARARAGDRRRPELEHVGRGRQRGLPGHPQLGHRRSGEQLHGPRRPGAEKVCLLGDTVAARPLPGPGPGRPDHPRQEPALPRARACSAPKGQGQWGQDQDDLMLAPYTTDPEEAARASPTSSRSSIRGGQRANVVEHGGGADHAADAPAPPHHEPRTTTTSRCARVEEMAADARADGRRP